MRLERTALPVAFSAPPASSTLARLPIGHYKENESIDQLKQTTLLFLACLPLLGGCAANGDERDPLEAVNRPIHAFNETVDRVAMKPLAEGYRAITPDFVETGVRNFFSNLDDVSAFANNLMQFKLEAAASDVIRIGLNSSFGMLGFLDIASEAGIRKHNEDFGQTLGAWGINPGPYLVLPLLGPSDLRDATGLIVDNNYLDPVRHIEEVGVRNRTAIVRVVSRRADLLEAKAAVDQAALDGYEFTRDFYLERRKALVHDGQPPREE